jgi:Y-X(10)_GDL-associated radical SAM protein
VSAPPRYRSEADYKSYVPVHVVWEITLACDLKCMHCGSRAGHRRPRELDTQECLEVVESLARLGTREVSLIGGESYLRKDWTDIIRAITSNGMYCAIQTGGRQLTPARLKAAVEAGLGGIGVSIDGLEELHDRVRGVPGAFKQAFELLRQAKDAGLNTSVNTQIGSDTARDLRELMQRIIDADARQWQLQLTVAMGNAVDNPSLLLQPHQVLTLMPLLADLYFEALSRNLLLLMGNNVGYFGPYEHIWRGFGDERMHWNGCSAGHTTLALETDGTVKGCPSLPTIGYTGGNVRDLKIEDIWASSPEIHFARLRSVEDLWGFCRSCYYADVCRGGCTWTAHSLLGRPGNNPYCHYRATSLAKQGMRERIVKIRDAECTPFAIGAFELIRERITDGQTVSSSLDDTPTLVNLAPPQTQALEGRVPPKLEVCRGCDCYIKQDEKTCPHCGASVEEAAEIYKRETSRRKSVMEEIRQLLYPSEKNDLEPSRKVEAQLVD